MVSILDSCHISCRRLEKRSALASFAADAADTDYFATDCEFCFLCLHFCGSKLGLWMYIVDRLQLLPVLGRAAMNVCVGAQENHYFHVGKKARKQLQSKPEEEREHYLFLYAAQGDCVCCCKFWLANGASLSRGSRNHPQWNALAWAEHAQAQRRHGTKFEKMLDYTRLIVCFVVDFVLWFCLLLLAMRPRTTRLLKGLEEEEREEEEEDETPKGIRKDQNSDVDLDGANESEAKCPLVDFCAHEDKAEMLYAAATVTGNVEALQCNYCEKRWSAFA